jgi:hypothetical protein
MPPLVKRLGLVINDGVVAAIVQVIAIYLFGALGLFRLIELPTPTLGLFWSIKQVLWGGVYALLFLVPVLTQSRQVMRGLNVGLLRAAVTLFVINPMEGHGMLGLGLGFGWPVIVILFNLLWGAVAGWTFGRVTGELPDEELMA